MSESTREDVIDVLVMSPMTDQMGTSMVPIRQTADAVLALFAPLLAAARREGQADAWDEGHSWGWSDAQESHDVRQRMARADWPLCTPNPYESEEDRHVDQ